MGVLRYITAIVHYYVKSAFSCRQRLLKSRFFRSETIGMEDSSVNIDDNGIEEEVTMNGTDNDIQIVEDDEDEDEEDVVEKITENDDDAGAVANDVKEDKKVFVKKKILNDDEWFAQIPEKELKYYKKHVFLDKDLDESTVVCTACFRQVNHKHAGAVVRHPELGVPICKQCKKFYHMGEWTRGEDGFFEYCRWCANGGDLLLCDSCSNAFCKKCIKRNLGRSKVSEIEEVDEWFCLACQPKQVWKQRSMYYSVWLYQKNMLATEEEKEDKKKKEEKTNFIDETLKDGFDVNKILGNYMDRAKKSWSRKSQDYNQDDLAKVVVKLRTIIKITHHNLQLLDKNLVAGCKSSFPGIDLDKLAAASIPDEKHEKHEEPKQSNAVTNGVKEVEETIDDDSKNNCDDSSLEQHEETVSTNNAEIPVVSIADGETVEVNGENENESINTMDIDESVTSDKDTVEDIEKPTNESEVIEKSCEEVKPTEESEEDKFENEATQSQKSDSYSDEKNTKDDSLESNEDKNDESVNVEDATKSESINQSESNIADVSKDMFSNSDNEEVNCNLSTKAAEKIDDKKDEEEHIESEDNKDAETNLNHPATDVSVTGVEQINTEDMETSELTEELPEPDISKVPEEEEEDIDSEEANARARAAVLQTTSSESEQANLENVAPTETEDSSPRKKLKTKKELDKIRRKSAGEDKQGSSDEEKKLPTTPKSKKKLKIATSTPKPRSMSGSASGSGKDLMGISGSDGENAPKIKKKSIGMKKKKLQNGTCSDSSPKKKARTKSGAMSTDSSDLGGSDMDSDEKAYRKKQKKREKRNLKKLIEELNDMASKINIEDNLQLQKFTQVNVPYLNRSIKGDLKEYDEVDVTLHSSLAKLASAKSAGDRDIERSWSLVGEAGCSHHHFSLHLLVAWVQYSQKPRGRQNNKRPCHLLLRGSWGWGTLQYFKNHHLIVLFQVM